MKASRRARQPFGDELAVLDLALAQPVRHVLQEGAVQRGEVADDEAAQGQALDQHRAHQGRRPVRARRVAGHRVVVGDQAAHRHAGEGIEPRQHRIPDLAADILEIDVDALRAGVLQLRREIGVAMIQALVEAELFLDVAALVGAAGDADGAGAGDLRDLADRGADRAGGRGHHHGFAGLRLADLVQARIGGHAGHAEHADGGRDRRQLRDRSCAAPCRRTARSSASRCARARCRPWRNARCCDCTTSATVPPSITASIATGAA